MIHALWIIDRSGKIVFFKSYLGEEIKSEIVGGLLTAIQTFASDVSEEGVSYVLLENKLFTYKISRGEYFVLCTDEKEDVGQVLEKIEEAYASGGNREELAEEVDKVIKKYNREKELESLSKILHRVENII